MKQSLMGRFLHYAATVIMPESGETKKFLSLKLPQRFRKGKFHSTLNDSMDRTSTKNKKTFSYMYPEWRGIRSSTEELFDEIYYLEDNLDQEYQNIMLTFSKKRIVQRWLFKGFLSSYLELVRNVHKDITKTPIYVIWHVVFYKRKRLFMVRFPRNSALHNDGVLTKIGFVKQVCRRL
jgi:hypothetical protein